MHFVLYNLSASLTDWRKNKDIFEMPSKFSVGQCQTTLSDVTIWPRYDQICEDNWKLKSTFLRLFQQKFLVIDGPHGS